MKTPSNNFSLFDPPACDKHVVDAYLGDANLSASQMATGHKVNDSSSKPEDRVESRAGQNPRRAPLNSPVSLANEYQGKLKKHFDNGTIWKGGDVSQHRRIDSVSTEIPALDKELTSQGWPKSETVEILGNEPSDSWNVLLPQIVRATQAKRYVAIIASPFPIFAPGMVAQGVDLDYVWILDCKDAPDEMFSIIEALRSEAFDCIIAWESFAFDFSTLRKFAIAAQQHKGLFFFIRHSQTAKQSSPARTRLEVQSTHKVSKAQVLKQRGCLSHTSIELPKLYCASQLIDQGDSSKNTKGNDSDSKGSTSSILPFRTQR